MTAELKAIEELKNHLNTEQYRLVLAKVCVNHLKYQVSNRTQLFKEVNKVLMSYGLTPVSYNFIRINE